MAELKKVPIKVNENGSYIDIFPETYADIVYLNGDGQGNVGDKLDNLEGRLMTLETTPSDAVVLRVSSTQPVDPIENMIWVKP